MKWIWNRCRRRQDISLLAAGALGEYEKIEAEQHLAACQECRSYYAEIKSLTAPLGGWEKNQSHIEATPAARIRWARAVQEAGAASAVRIPRLKNFWGILWNELIRPNRYVWSGMAALWVIMLAVNMQLSDHRANDAGARASSSQDMIQAWEEQNRVLAELTRLDFVIPAPPPNLPRPRSQREQDWAVI